VAELPSADGIQGVEDREAGVGTPETEAEEDDDEPASEPGGGTQDVADEPEPSVDPDEGQADDPEPVPNSESSTVVFEEDAGSTPEPSDVKGVVTDDEKEQRVQEFAEQEVRREQKRERQLRQNKRRAEQIRAVNQQTNLSRQETPVPQQLLDDQQQARRVMSRAPLGALDSRNRQQLQPGQTQTGGEDIFGNPVSDTLQFFQVSESVGGLPSIPETVRQVEDFVTDQLGGFASDVREVQQGKPAETTTEELLSRFDDATRAEGLQGEQSGLDVVQGVTEGAADVSQFPEAVEEFASRGETDALEQSREFTPDETPVVTLGRLGVEEAAFEGGIRAAARGQSLLDEALPGARATRGRRVGNDGSTSAFDADQRITVSERGGNQQSRLPGTVDESVDVGPAQGDQSVGSIDTIDESEEVETLIVDEQTGETLPVGPRSDLGERIVSANPERFSAARVEGRQPGEPSGERLAEELVGEGVDSGDVSVRDTLSRVSDETGSGVDEVQTRLTGEDNQVLQGDRVAQEVEQARITVINEDTGRIRRVDEDEAFDLLQDDDFRFAGRQLSPREQARVRSARREVNRRGLRLPDEVRQRQRDVQTEFAPEAEQPSSDSLLSLNRKGGARFGSRQRGLPDGLEDFVDDVGQAFRDTDVLVDTVRRGDDLFPEARSLDEFVDDGSGFGRGRPRPRGVSSVGLEQGNREGVSTDVGSLTQPRQDSRELNLSDSVLGEDSLRLQDQGSDTDVLRDTEETPRLDQPRQDTDTTIRPRRPRDPDGGSRRRPRRGETPRDPDFDIDMDSVTGDRFVAEVRDEGEFEQIGVFDDVEQAFESAEERVDTSDDMTFQVENLDGSAVDAEPPGDFRESESGPGFVERRDDAIDTAGEFSDLDVNNGGL